MPHFLVRLFLLARVGNVIVFVDLLCLLRTDDANLIVFPSMLSARVADRMNVKFRGGRLSSQFSETLRKDFLKVIVKIVLLAEEDYASLGDLKS